MSTIRVDLPEARGDRGAHPPDIDPPITPGECASLGRCSRGSGLTAQCSGCRAIRTGFGYPANHTERCPERIEQELEKKPEGASKVARDRERIKRARHEERSPRHENRGTLSNDQIARSLKELARQALVMVLEMNGRPVAMSPPREQS